MPWYALAEKARSEPDHDTTFYDHKLIIPKTAQGDHMLPLFVNTSAGEAFTNLLAGEWADVEAKDVFPMEMKLFDAAVNTMRVAATANRVLFVRTFPSGGLAISEPVPSGTFGAMVVAAGVALVAAAARTDVEDPEELIPNAERLIDTEPGLGILKEPIAWPGPDTRELLVELLCELSEGQEPGFPDGPYVLA